MTVFRIVICVALIIGIVLSSPVEKKVTEKKPVAETTTHIPLKVNAAKNLNAEKVQNGNNNAHIGKSATKKRNVPEILSDKNEYFDDDIYEGKVTEDYDGNPALRPYLDNSRNDNTMIDFGKFRVNDYRYFDEEARRKRTAAFEPEIRLTPEDLMILASYKQPQRTFNAFPYGRWSDINNSFDIPEADEEYDESFEKPENFFDRYYDQRYQNWANMPRSNKFITNRQGKTYSGHSRPSFLQVPVYKRAVL